MVAIVPRMVCNSRTRRQYAKVKPVAKHDPALAGSRCGTDPHHFPDDPAKYILAEPQPDQERSHRPAAPSLGFRAPPSNPALRMLRRAFGRARDARRHRINARQYSLRSQLLLGSAFRVSPSNPALRILRRAFGRARDARRHRVNARQYSLRSQLLPGSAFRASPSNPALRILRRAFGRARDARRHRVNARPHPLG